MSVYRVTVPGVIVIIRGGLDRPRDMADNLLAAGIDALTGLRGCPAVIKRRMGRRPTARIDKRAIYLSLSHSRAVTVVAAAFSPVGVDVERHRRVHAARGVAIRLGGALPLHWNADEHQPTLNDDVIAAWTRYEAVVKAIGAGTVIGLTTVTARLGESSSFGAISLPLHPITLRLADRHNAVHGYTVSIAARPDASILIDHDGTNIHVPTHTETEVAMETTTIDREELRTLVAETLDLDIAEVTDEADFVTDLDVDSLMALEVMVVLERRYQVKLDEKRLAEITSLSSAQRLLVEALERKA